MPSNPYRPFHPDPAQTALVPKVSGNAINGRGETEPRRPRMVYWAPDPDDIPHGELQRWFYTVEPPDPAMAEARIARRQLTAMPIPDVTGPPVERPPGEWTRALDAFVTDGLCERIGAAEMSPDWVYEGHEVPQSRIIVAGVHHDYDAIATAPAWTAGTEVVRQYGRASLVAKQITAWLRRQGWPAEPVTGPLTGAVTLIPPAIACGFGELGKHGSIINPEFGASFRLSAVLTDAPFAATPSREFGIDDFCASCRVCENACPPEAISPAKQTVRGREKWYVDFDKCLPFFNQTYGCAICIAVCPWSRPGVGPNLAAKLARRAGRQTQEKPLPP